MTAFWITSTTCARWLTSAARSSTRVDGDDRAAWPPAITSCKDLSDNEDGKTGQGRGASKKALGDSQEQMRAGRCERGMGHANTLSCTFASLSLSAALPLSTSAFSLSLSLFAHLNLAPCVRQAFGVACDDGDVRSMPCSVHGNSAAQSLAPARHHDMLQPRHTRRQHALNAQSAARAQQHALSSARSAHSQQRTLSMTASTSALASPAGSTRVQRKAKRRVAEGGEREAGSEDAW